MDSSNRVFAEELEAALDAVLMRVFQHSEAVAPRRSDSSGAKLRHAAEAPTDQSGRLAGRARSDHNSPSAANLDDPADTDAAIWDWPPNDPESEALRIPHLSEEPEGAHCKAIDLASARETGDWPDTATTHHRKIPREPGRWGGGLTRNMAHPASILNALLVIGVISLTVVLAPSGLPTGIAVDDVSTSDAAAIRPGNGEVEQGGPVTEARIEVEALSSVQEQVAGRLAGSIRGPAHSGQATVNDVASEEGLALTEEPKEPSALARTSIADDRGGTVLRPIDNGRTAMAAHPATADSHTIREQLALTQTALPEERLSDGRFAASAPAAEEQLKRAAHSLNEPAESRAPSAPAEVPATTLNTTPPFEPVSPGPAATQLSGGGDLFAADAQGANDAEIPPAVTRSTPVTTAVNMRAGPNMEAAVVTVVAAGSEVGVIACQEWCDVVYGGERGWINERFVSDSSVALPAGGGGGVDDGSNIAGSDAGHVGASAAAASASVGSSAASSANPVGHATAAMQPVGTSELLVGAGLPLISADGVHIGVVRDLTTDATGQVLVVVDLAQELGAAVPSIRLRAEHVAAADQHVRLNFTRARLWSSLPGQ
jgi:hypothetical protein